MIRRIVVNVALVLFGVAFVGSFFVNHSYVTTPSMYPTIPPGSEIFARAESSYHPGEVIEFRANGLVWAHRLIEIKPNGTYVTKGDNPENVPDVFVPPVTKAGVVGAVVFAPRWIGFPEMILHHPAYGLAWLRAELGLPGKLLLVAITLLLIIFWPAPRSNALRARARHRPGPAAPAHRAVPRTPGGHRRQPAWEPRSIISSKPKTVPASTWSTDTIHVTQSAASIDDELRLDSTWLFEDVLH